MDDDILDRIRELEDKRDNAVERKNNLMEEMHNKIDRKKKYINLQHQIISAKKVLKGASSNGNSAVNNLNANYKGKVAKKRSSNYLNSFSIINDVNRNLDTCLTEAAFKISKLKKEIEDLEIEIMRISHLIDYYNNELDSLY